MLIGRCGITLSPLVLCASYLFSSCFLLQFLLSFILPLKLGSALKTAMNHQPDVVISVKGAGLGTNNQFLSSYDVCFLSKGCNHSLVSLCWGLC